MKATLFRPHRTIDTICNKLRPSSQIVTSSFAITIICALAFVASLSLPSQSFAESSAEGEDAYSITAGTSSTMTAAANSSSGQLSSITRLAGSDRYQTMAKIVAEGFSKSDYAVVATGANFPDALAANALAGAYGCPVVLTAKNSLSSETRSMLQKLEVKKAFIMGGTAAVSSETESSIRGMGISTERVAGSTRQDTSLKALQKVKEKIGSISAVIIATGYNFADTLSIGPWSYANCAPIVLTSGDGTLTSAEASAIKELGNVEVIVVGGTAVVSEGVKTQLGRGFTRLAGADRYATSQVIANWEKSHSLGLYSPAVATGANYPDALAGAALCGSRGSVLVLVSDSNTSAIDALSGTEGSYVFGGTSAVSSSVESKIRQVSSSSTVNDWWQTNGQSGSVYHHFVSGTDYIYQEDIMDRDTVRHVSTYSVALSPFERGKYSFAPSNGLLVTLSSGSTYFLYDSSPNELQCRKTDGSGYSGTSSLHRIADIPAAILESSKNTEEHLNADFSAQAELFTKAYYDDWTFENNAFVQRSGNSNERAISYTAPGCQLYRELQSGTPGTRGYKGVATSLQSTSVLRMKPYEYRVTIRYYGTQNRVTSEMYQKMIASGPNTQSFTLTFDSTGLVIDMF